MIITHININKSKLILFKNITTFSQLENIKKIIILFDK